MFKSTIAALGLAGLLAASPALADTYTSAAFTGQIAGGSANVRSPFTNFLTQGQALSGTFIFDNALIPAAGTGFVNVNQASFPDVADFSSASLFTFNLGSLVLTRDDVVAGANLLIQYNNGVFNGFATRLGFQYLGLDYALDIQGRTFTVYRSTNGVLNRTVRYVNGTLNTGLTNQVPVVPGVPGIPEPESWALLILGFGMVGAALRRRRQSIAFA